jgi:DNA-binding GntR family transcriptional regulator
MDAEELAQAVEILDRVVAATEADDPERMMNESLALLEYLVSKSANPVFSAMMAETSLLVARNLRHLRPEEGSAVNRVECFREMRAAMLAGDADAAEKWFRRQHGIGVDTSL